MPTECTDKSILLTTNVTFAINQRSLDPVLSMSVFIAVSDSNTWIILLNGLTLSSNIYHPYFTFPVHTRN